MNLTEKVAYIKGLMEGMKLDDTKEEIKILKSMADLLEDITLSITELDDKCDENSELIDVLDEDLGDVEEILCAGDDECQCCGDLDDGDLYEVSCPNCSDTVCVNEEMLDEGEISCPNCGETLEFDFTGDISDSIPK